MNRTRHNKRRRLALIKGRTHVECCWCKKTFEAKDITLEHILPKSCGGTNAWINLALACEPCNHGRGQCGKAECEFHKSTVPSKRQVTRVERVNKLLQGNLARTDELNQVENEYTAKLEEDYKKFMAKQNI